MRAFRILAQRPERAVVALAELCEERKGDALVSAPSYHSRPPTLPPQTPYTVGNQTLRPKMEERLSPPAQFFEPGQPSVILRPVAVRSPPEHMAPKRGKWTSPPPPEAPSADHKLFENQLGMVLQLATSSTEAREKDTASETNSEVFTDEGSDAPDDDIKSVKSYTEGSPPTHQGPLRRPSWHTLHQRSPNTFNNTLLSHSSSPSSSTYAQGRFTRPPDQVELIPPASQADEHVRRSSSGHLPRSINPPNPCSHLVTPEPPSPISTTSSPIVNARFPFPSIDPANVYYQASPIATALRAVRHGQPSSLAYSRQPSSSPGCPSDSGPQNSHSPSPLTGHVHSPQTQDHTSSPYSNRQMQSPLERNNHSDTITIKSPVPRDTSSTKLPPSITGLSFRSGGESRTFSFGSPDTPTPATVNRSQQKQQQQQQLRPQSGPSNSSHSRSDSIKGKVGSFQKRGSPRLSTPMENPSRQGTGNLISPQQEAVQPLKKQTSNHENSDVHNSSSSTLLNSGLDANRAPISPALSSPEIESFPSHRRVADPSSSLKLAPGESVSSGSSPTQSSTGYSSGVSGSPSPPSSSPPHTAMPQKARNMNKVSGKEGFGPIGLQASDSVATIKAEGRGE